MAPSSVSWPDMFADRVSSGPEGFRGGTGGGGVGSAKYNAGQSIGMLIA